MMAVTWQSISIALRQCHSLSASSLAHQIKLMTLKMCEVCLVFFCCQSFDVILHNVCTNN